MFVSLFRIIKFALQNFWRNIWLSLITISILVLTLVTVNILISLNFLGQSAVGIVQSKIDVSVYFNPDTSEETVQNVRSYLLGLSQVRDVTYVSAEEALENFKQTHADNEDIMTSLEELEENPLGAALTIKANNPSDYPFILETLENPEFTDFIQDKDYDDHEEIIQRIDNITSRLERTGIVLSLVFVIIAVLIVFNTIRVAIYTHREEVGIMKLVGASNWFVRAPFLLESILYSLLATGLAIAIIYPSIYFAEPYIAKLFDNTDISLINYFNANFVWIFVSQFVVLSVLNIVSTAMALGRYLKV
jgi:cell division transport system permease protein